MKYTLTTKAQRVYLETTDDDNDSLFYVIDGNTLAQSEDVPRDRLTLATGQGDWHDFGGVAEFRASNWKLRSEGDVCSTRTGDGANVEHLFSGVGPGRTGESAAARLVAFFGAEK